MDFSVLICVYGQDTAEHFKTAVDSILNQTVRPSEVVLVVDGPVPACLDEAISTYENNEIFKLVRFAENQGHGNARRAGIDACTNELVAIMDADDISLPQRFEKQIREFERDSDLDIVGGNISEFIGNEENIIASRVVFQTDEEIKEDMKSRCPMNQMTVMFKKASIEAVGGYIDWFQEEDYYLWLRMAKGKQKFKNIPETLVNVRVGEEMYSRRGGIKYFKSEAKLQKYMLKEGFIGPIDYIINVLKRLVVQVLLPNKVRAWVFKKFARK